MIKIKRLFSLCSATACALLTLNTYAQITSSDANPHFYVQMENQTNKAASISFQPVAGKVALIPVLTPHTPLPAQERSQKYGVVFDPLGRNDTFNMVFTGKQDCAFNIAFYAPNNPKITIAGPGCFGGGYRVNGNTLELYISDIHIH